MRGIALCRCNAAGSPCSSVIASVGEYAQMSYTGARSTKGFRSQSSSGVVCGVRGKPIAMALLARKDSSPLTRSRGTYSSGALYDDSRLA